MSGLRAVCLTSGGLDSAVALVALKRNPAIESITAVWVNYGQANRTRERRAASDVARLTHVGGRSAEFEVVDVEVPCRALWSSTSLCSGAGIPDARPGTPNVDAMFVPGRNTILVSLGLAVAQRIGARLLVIGVHGGDHVNFLDCRPDWVQAMSGVAALHGVMLNAPFAHLRKADIVRMGHDMGIPWNLTWSCYRGGSVHCGRCPACLARKDAFQEAEVLDALVFVR